MESRINVKPEIISSSGKALHNGYTILLNVCFSFPINSPDSFILLYNLEEEYTCVNNKNY